MKKIAILTFTFLICFMVNSQTISDSDNLIIEKIKQGNTKNSSIESKFKQTKHLSILGENINSVGKFHYCKPDKLAMRYEDPAGDLMLINGDKFVMVSGGKRNETTSKANAKMRGMKTILSACLQGDINSIGAGKVTCSESPKYYIITAEINTKNNKSNISKIVASYDKKDLSLSVLQTIEPDESYIIYELVEKKLNQNIDPDIFISNKK